MDLINNNIVNPITFQTIGDWVPKRVVQEFFNYGNTKMSTFANDYNVEMSKVGRRIFYKYSDIIRLINDGQENDNF
jgi:hypothetical protein